MFVKTRQNERNARDNPHEADGREKTGGYDLFQFVIHLNRLLQNRVYSNKEILLLISVIPNCTRRISGA